MEKFKAFMKAFWAKVEVFWEALIKPTKWKIISGSLLVILLFVLLFLR